MFAVVKQTVVVEINSDIRGGGGRDGGAVAVVENNP
jgi:hypothetical protein